MYLYIQLHITGHLYGVFDLHQGVLRNEAQRCLCNVERTLLFVDFALAYDLYFEYSQLYRTLNYNTQYYRTT